MKTQRKLLSLLLGGTVLLPAGAFAITIQETNDAAALANTLFLNLNGSLAIQDVGLSGEFGQSGLYENPQGTYGLPNAGIVLSTGNVNDYATGTNDESGTTTAYNDGFEGGGEEGGGTATEEQVAILGPISGQDDFFDVVQLDIQFFANTAAENVTFFATFGSEEFPEFQNSGVNDGFGLIVNGVNVAGVTPTNGGPNLPVNIDNPDFRDIAGTELDGVLAPNGNPVLQFDVPIIPGQLNNFTVILADAGDAVLDTTVYLSSFFADPGTGPGTPATGQSEFDPLLPSNPPDPETGEFVIEIPFDDPNTEEDEGFQNGETIWIDPPISVGYEYTINGAGTFAGIQAPSLATVADIDGYTISANGLTFDLAAGQELDLFDLFGAISSFTLNGIDESLNLDPLDPMAFPIGVIFAGADQFTTVSVTPLTVNNDPTTPIPLPAGGLLYVCGLLMGGGLLRRRQKKNA